MAGVRFINVDKIYPGGTKAVSGFSLDITDREFMVIMGPSGCGKSTILKLIAGLEKPTSGQILIAGEDVACLPPGKRGTAIVMQTNALFPHMSVFNNLAFGLTVLKTDKETVRQKVLSAAETLGISDLLKRKPSSLSGGQRQRVALGRALVVSPRIFLLDEPLSNLDATLKISMRAEIKRLHKATGTTFVYVTHDQQEAMSLGERIAVLKDGILTQADTPRQIYDNPANKFTAQFIGTSGMNFLDAKITKDKTSEEKKHAEKKDSDAFTICFCGRKMQIKPDFFLANQALEFINELDSLKEYELTMGIRPEHILVVDESETRELDWNLEEKGRNTKDYFLTCARINLIESAGSENIIHAALDKDCDIVLKCSARRNLLLDSLINIVIDKSKIKFFNKKTGITLV